MKDRRVMADVERTAPTPGDIRPGALVMGVDGELGRELGRVSRVVVDPDGDQIVGLMLRESHSPHRDIAIPIALVEGVTDDLVRLGLTIDDLDEYRDDDQITDAILDTLWYRSDLPEDDVRDVKVRTVDGIVELSGYTGTEQARAAIESITRRVRGVLGVRDGVRSLEALADAARPFEHIRDPGEHRVGSE
jgi:hypothetical protein